ncbi:MAG: acetyl-CoA carboxylase, biotin carboxyl carrier protein [Candidatus Latescibacteria bacterium 4484_7]|nr:MAG: acetyl-CoA carboxylase, biotin carboxyl carrier protein [Candidatus Latescibacteria bacterium 4484_7]
MLYDTIKKLIEIVKREDIDEIEVRRFFTSIRVVRRREGTPNLEASSVDESGRAGRETIQQENAAVRDEAEQSHSLNEGIIAGGSRSSVDSSAVDQSGQNAADTSDNIVSIGEHNAGKGVITVRSPMVGTFYMARSPESDPFVYEGKEVKVGEVLCVIEAMKLMNEIESETDGIVEKILVENAQPVEYGQPLFLIKSA